jgi:hypothetical protein
MSSGYVLRSGTPNESPRDFRGSSSICPYLKLNHQNLSQETRKGKKRLRLVRNEAFSICTTLATAGGATGNRGVRPAILAIPGFEYSWLHVAATIENRKSCRPDPDSSRFSAMRSEPSASADGLRTQLGSVDRLSFLEP